jgi:hypothetical protein
MMLAKEDARRLKAGWGARIRTWEWRNQNPLPYHLATPHHMARIATIGRADHNGMVPPDQRRRAVGLAMSRPVAADGPAEVAFAPDFR